MSRKHSLSTTNPDLTAYGASTMQYTRYQAKLEIQNLFELRWNRFTDREVS